MNKRTLDRYFRILRKNLLCANKEKKRILSDLRINAENWIESHPEGDEQAFLDAFGTPEDIAASYMEEMGYTDVSKKILLRKRFSKTVFLLAMAAMIALIVFAIQIAIPHDPPAEIIGSLPAEYASQVGLPWEQALQNLGLTEDDLRQSGITLYQIPHTVTLRGCTFDVYLIYDSKTKCLTAFEYYLKGGNPEDFPKLYDAMVGLYGQPYRAGITDESLHEVIRDKTSRSASSAWVTRRYSSDELKEYRDAWNKDSFFADLPPAPYSLKAQLLIKRNTDDSYTFSISYSLAVVDSK